jgi:hypothetical protein
VTTQQLIDLFRDLADDKALPYLWSDFVMTQYAAEAEMEAARRARLLKDSTTAAVCQYAVTAGTQKITLDPRIIFIRSVKIGSKTIPLARFHRTDMDLAFPDWDNTVNLGDVNRFIPDRDSGILWFDGQFPASDTVYLTVVREPLLALTIPTVAVGAKVVTNMGGPGVLTTTSNVPGTAGNSLHLAFVAGIGANVALSITWNGTTATVTLGTDSGSALDPTKNTFVAIAVLLNALVGNPLTAVNTSNATDFVTGASNTAFSGGAALSGSTVNPEIPARYHMSLVNWMLFRAFGKQDAETNDPVKAATAEKEFEAEFGKKSSAIDEKYIEDNYGYDGYDGVF